MRQIRPLTIVALLALAATAAACAGDPVSATDESTPQVLQLCEHQGSNNRC